MEYILSPNFLGQRDKDKNVSSNFSWDSSHILISCTILGILIAMIMVIQDVTPCALAERVLAFPRNIDVVLSYPEHGSCILNITHVPSSYFTCVSFFLPPNTAQ